MTVAGNTGPLETQAWVVPEKGAKLELRTITLPALKATDVEVEIQYNGLCHTDIHMRDNGACYRRAAVAVCESGEGGRCDDWP